MHNSPNSRPNMQQIADAVGCSKSAVSLALRNDPRLPVATRQRIKSIAEKMGYRRNPVVDSLMTQLRAGRQPSFQANLGLINCSPFKDLSENHTFRRLREGVFARAEALGYGVEEFWLQQPDMRPERLHQIIEARGIRGLLLIATVNPDAVDFDYDKIWQDFACAVVGVTPLNNKLNCSTNDQYLTARNATKKIFEFGYKRPMLIVSEKDDNLLENRFCAGYQSVFLGYKSADQIPLVTLLKEDIDQALIAIRNERPDAIITNISELYDALENDGYEIPKRLAFVHLDWYDSLTQIAGMRQNNRIVGSAGVDLVVGQLQKNETGSQDYPKVIQIESVWVDGPSIALVK
ncbi:MAG: LacI family DNA-binding transcriptional regulator [Verrucomicrobiota bacterium]|nr:LacI family DNA-binding transcriptional regulator [Verrucomicrobiota bacterium]